METVIIFQAWLMNHAHKYKLNARSASDNPVALVFFVLERNICIFTNNSI